MKPETHISEIPPRVLRSEKIALVLLQFEHK